MRPTDGWCPACKSSCLLFGGRCGGCDAVGKTASQLAAELKDAREHADQLDRNWAAVHEAAMGPIRAAVGLPDGTVPEIVDAIRKAGAP